MAMVQVYPGHPNFRKKIGFMPDFSGAKFANQEEPTGIKDGKNKIFKLLHRPIDDSLQVFKDGMMMTEELDFKVDLNTKRIAFDDSQIPEEKSVIRVMYKYYE